ncbi:MAG TPA: type II secretion system F family protein [Patescibacteria group bacterium]|nr:type II secretion system F family protein [Patescibacteria group bacterium]
MTIPFLKRISSTEKAFFVRQIATMLQAGLPLLRALDIVTEQTKNPNFKIILESVGKRVREGYQLSQAMAEYPQVFPGVFTAVIRSGESTGRMDRVMLELAQQQEEDNKFRGGVYNAMLYPAFVVLAMLVIGIYLVFKIIPQIATLFAEQQAQLPWMTTMLIGIVNAITRYWYVFIVALAGAIWGLVSFLRTAEGRAFWGRLVIKTPIIRDLSMGIYITRFSRMMAMLARSGVPVLESVEIIHDAMSNVLYQESMDDIKASLERGLPMSKPLMENPIWPPLVGQMVLVGEQSGKVDEVLDSVANYYQDRVSTNIRGLSSLIEPVLIVLLGLGVAFIVFAIFVPIYQLTSIS